MIDPEKGLRLLDALERIVVETDEEDPVAIATLTQDGVSLADGYRIRIRPNCN